MASDGYRIVVTGATGGLGEAIVQHLLKSGQGHRIVGTTRSVSNPKVAELQSWAEANGAGDRLFFVELDYASTESVNKGIAAAVEKLGEIDIVINNAGVGFSGIVETFSPEQYLDQLNINVVGPHRVNKAVLPAFRARRSGVIINVSSLLGRKVIPFFGVYSSSKFALESQSEALRLELNPIGVQVLIVEPGAIKTPFHAATVAGDDEAVLETAGYSSVAAQKAAVGAAFGKFLSESTTATADSVGEAVRNLIETAPAARPFRTIVDPLSGGDDVKQINQLTEELLAVSLVHLHSSNLLTLATN